MGLLRDATFAPQYRTAAEITNGVLAAKGITDANDRQRRGIEAGIRSCLESNAGKTVQRVGDGVPRQWRTTPSR
jgi:hypothetical protein